VRCPRCGTEHDVPEDVHYQQLPCPSCGGRFQAVTEATQEISREFIFEYLRSLEKKPE
jgi:transcription elongation factor Elf1